MKKIFKEFVDVVSDYVARKMQAFIFFSSTYLIAVTFNKEFNFQVWTILIHMLEPQADNSGEG